MAIAEIPKPDSQRRYPALRTNQSSSDPHRNRSAAYRRPAPGTTGGPAKVATGELLNSEFSSYPPASTTTLTPQVLHYWGLLASPFSPPQSISQPPQNTDFYFRSEAHAGTWAWLQNLVRRPGCCSILTTSAGAGASTLLRHLATTSGLGGTAVEVALAQWDSQSLDHVTDGLRQAAGSVDSTRDVRTLWLVETGPRSHACAGFQRAEALADWYQARAQSLTNLTVMMVVRKSVERVRVVPHTPRAIPSHHLARFSEHEFIRCVNASLRHAGGTRPAFTVAATERLAEAAAGSITMLGRLVHTALLHGSVKGLRQISRTDLGSRLSDEVAASRAADLSRAA